MFLNQPTRRLGSYYDPVATELPEYDPPTRHLGQDDALEWASTAVPQVGMSPLWIAGLGLLVAAFALSKGKKTVGNFQRKRKVRARRQARIQALKAELQAAKLG
jgi:hypothetical protein